MLDSDYKSSPSRRGRLATCASASSSSSSSIIITGDSARSVGGCNEAIGGASDVLLCDSGFTVRLGRGVVTNKPSGACDRGGP